MRCRSLELALHRNKKAWISEHATRMWCAAIRNRVMNCFDNIQNNTEPEKKSNHGVCIHDKMVTLCEKRRRRWVPDRPWDWLPRRCHCATPEVTTEFGARSCNAQLQRRCRARYVQVLRILRDGSGDAQAPEASWCGPSPPAKGMPWWCAQSVLQLLMKHVYFLNPYFKHGLQWLLL